MNLVVRNSALTKKLSDKFCLFLQTIFTPQPLRLWGIVVTRGGRSGGRSGGRAGGLAVKWAGGRAVRNSALTEKLGLTDEFCLLFTDMT